MRGGRENRRVSKRSRRDAPRPWQMGFQEPGTPIAEGIIRFHHDMMFVLVRVSVFVAWMMGRCVRHFNEEKNGNPSNVVHGTVIEVVWTRRPARTLVGIAVPSFALLYSVDERVNPGVTVKVVGHQWYWTYEYSDYGKEDGEGIVLESYMLPDEELREGHLRLLEVDNRMVRPMDTHVRRIVTAADVLHSWAVPSLGVKIDACPGRLNQVSRYVRRPGVYYGQCSEICGVNHGFMPIAVEARTRSEYVKWVGEQE